MTAFFRETLKPALILFGALSLLTGLAYPLLVTGLAQTLFPRQAQGSLIAQGGIQRGSLLLGQEFQDPAYFWGRPSATSPPCNAAASAGSNLGPSNPALFAAVRARAERLREADPAHRDAVPPDLVTASASGLDPQIRPESAFYQVPRVARARGLPEDRVRRLVEGRIEARQLGVLGEPRVNVLELNLALDRLTGHGPGLSARVRNGTMVQNLPGAPPAVTKAGLSQ